MTIEITPNMIDAMMTMMDKKLLQSDQNIWQDACEFARYNIAYEILEAALNEQKVA